jgi:hypothetical protein
MLSKVFAINFARALPTRSALTSRSRSPASLILTVAVAAKSLRNANTPFENWRLSRTSNQLEQQC